MQDSLLTSKNQLWQTPQDILDLVTKVGPIALDPASCEGNPTNAIAFYTPAEDGLIQPWARNGLNYVNPPYKYSKAWVKKAVAEKLRGSDTIMCIPARTETTYWQDWIFPTADSICFYRGRIKFIDPTTNPPTRKNPAVFPSALVYWGKEEGRRVFDEVMSQHGRVVHTKLSVR